MKIKIKNKKAKYAILIAIMVVIFILGICVGNVVSKSRVADLSTEETTTTQITEVEVGTQTIENTLTSSGEIASSGTESLSLTTSKYFETMCVEEGDTVDAGENILEYTDGTYLTAEYDCLIDSYSVPETGSICTSSNYIQVQNLETMTMNLSISEDEINKIEKGQEVEIELTAVEDTTYTGTITSVSSVGTYSTSGTTFSAVVEFENDGNAKIGMSATCTVVIEKAEDCIAVPIEAVQTSDDQKYVVVVNDNGTTTNVNIETGISNDSYVQVTSGLSGGETIQMVETVSTTEQSGGMGSFNMDDMGDFSFDSESMPGGGEMPSGGMPSGGTSGN